MNEESGVETRARIKAAAQRLFVDHGIENVSIRQIVAAAGQRHIGAITYYFTSKDALVEEILTDAAAIVDDRRNAALDSLEASGQAPTVRDIVALLIHSSLAPADAGEESFVRFFTVFTARNRNVFHRVVLNQIDRGYRRCVQHLRDNLAGMPRGILNERIICMMLSIGNNLEAREAAMERTDTEHVIGSAILRSTNFLDSLTDFCVAGLSAAPPGR